MTQPTPTTTSEVPQIDVTWPKLYTSNFAHHGKDPRAVAITVRPPIFIKGIRHCEALAPTWKMVDEYKSGKISEAEYTRRYFDLLDRRGTPEDVLVKLNDGDILLCYEKAGEFCHRHLAAQWLMRCPGVVVEEIKCDGHQ